MLKNTLLPLLASATLLSAEVPSAESLLEGIVRGEDSPAEAGSQIFRDLVVENADADTATAEHVALWVRGLRRAAAEGNREEEGFEILSQSFPAPGGWPTLAAALGEGDPAPAKPVLFQIALAEGNYPETGSWMGKKKEQPKQKGSLLRALLGGPSYESRMEDRQQFWFLKTAATRSVDREFSTAAMKDLLEVLAGSSRGYYGLWGVRFPGFEDLFGEEEAAAVLTKIFFRPNPPIDIDQLTPADREKVLSLLMERGVTDPERFSDFLTPDQPEFREVVDYLLENQVPNFPSMEMRTDWVEIHLRNGEIRKAREELGRIAGTEGREGLARTILELANSVGYRYSARSVWEAVEPMLDGLEPSVRMEVVGLLAPLDPENDVVLADLEDRLASAGDPSDSLTLAYVTRLLLLGRSDEAVRILDRFIEEGGRFQEGGDPDRYSTVNRLESFARVYFLLDDPEGVDAILAAMDELIDAAPLDEKARLQDSKISLLYDLGRPEEALEAAADLLATKVSIKRKDGYTWGMEEPLAYLTILYADLERYEDAIYLLERAPFWDGADLQTVRTSLGELSFPVAVARAEAGVGNVAMAVDVLQDHLARNGASDDDAYEFLISLRGSDTMAFLDRLIDMNPFEERPLIWKSVLLLEEGRLDEAEAVARAAIAVDPTDGEMGERDRLRAYAVLGDVLAARGEDEEANLMKKIVAAVDRAEEADELRIAGMVLPALELYQASLDQFADAYCIQFRTAVELKAAGRFEEAEEHLRRAYELMPHQFGRIESHCFGCEGAFRGEEEQNLAHEVFMEMVEEEPENPTLFYLLGYLETSRDQDDLALDYFRKAVELDPLYVNAWRKIREILDRRPLYENVELRRAMTDALIETGSPQMTDSMPLEWFPPYWERINRALAKKRWEPIADYPLGAQALPYEWPTDGRHSFGYPNNEPDFPTTAGTLFAGSTELMNAVREAAYSDY